MITWRPIKTGLTVTLRYFFGTADLPFQSVLAATYESCCLIVFGCHTIHSFEMNIIT